MSLVQHYQNGFGSMFYYMLGIMYTLPSSSTLWDSSIYHHIKGPEVFCNDDLCYHVHLPFFFFCSTSEHENLFKASRLTIHFSLNIFIQIVYVLFIIL